jgi:hypothetical protein
MRSSQGNTAVVSPLNSVVGPKGNMTREPPVGLPIWLLVTPPVALGTSLAALVASGWGTSTSPFAPPALLVGSLCAMLAIVLSWVLAPVGIYSLAKNPALRTAPQVGLILLAALIAALPVLALFGGGI